MRKKTHYDLIMCDGEGVDATCDVFYHITSTVCAQPYMAGHTHLIESCEHILVDILVSSTRDDGS